MARVRLYSLLFGIFAAIGFGFFFIPAFIIRPFTHQSASGLTAAMAIRDRAPLGSLISALICVAFALLLWPYLSRWKKALVASALVLVIGSAVMSRMNYFEWMFHPVESPRFEAESGSKLDTGEMVLAVKFGNDARAYPIREMAYHHIVNDWVNGVPVAVTY
jgi:hypothetical protein